VLISLITERQVPLLRLESSATGIVAQEILSDVTNIADDSRLRKGISVDKGIRFQSIYAPNCDAY
jgi:hypothetical protein